MHTPVDIVIPWVDGNDPAHLARRRAAMGHDTSLSAPDTGGDTRYADMGELHWAIASISRFAPWVRCIHIVTDRQSPQRHIDKAAELVNPTVPIEVVDHADIYRGYEQLLPVFNSVAIETMLWRIPNLADRYILFNDDTFFLAPTTPDDWWTADRMICYGHRFPLWWANLLQRLRPRHHGHKPQGFKTPMAQAARVLSEHHFIYYHHSPLAQNRRIIEQFFESNPALLAENAGFKFRSPQQFSTQALCNLLAEQQGALHIVNRNRNLFLKPKASRPDYLLNHLRRADGNRALLTGCINSLDATTDTECHRFADWMTRRLTAQL